MIITNKPGLERKFSKVILFTIITFGVYLLYWLHRNLTEMEQAFEFEKDETQVIRAKRFYWAGFFVVLLFVISVINIVLDNPQNMRLVFIYSYYYTVIITSVGLFFFYSFIKSVFLCQSKLKLSPFNKKAVYSLYIIKFIMDVLVAAAIFVLNLEKFVNEVVSAVELNQLESLVYGTGLKILGVISILNNAGNIVLVIFIYRLQLEINALWTCYKNPVCIPDTDKLHY